MFRRHRKGSTALIEAVDNKAHLNVEEYRFSIHPRKGRWQTLGEVWSEAALNSPSKRKEVLWAKRGTSAFLGTTIDLPS